MRRTRKDPERRSFLKSLKAQHVICFSVVQPLSRGWQSTKQCPAQAKRRDRLRMGFQPGIKFARYSSNTGQPTALCILHVAVSMARNVRRSQLLEAHKKILSPRPRPELASSRMQLAPSPQPPSRRTCRQARFSVDARICLKLRTLEQHRNRNLPLPPSEMRTTPGSLRHSAIACGTSCEGHRDVTPGMHKKPSSSVPESLLILTPLAFKRTYASDCGGHSKPSVFALPSPRRL